MKDNYDVEDFRKAKKEIETILSKLFEQDISIIMFSDNKSDKKIILHYKEKEDP